jgi:NTE family protein
VFPARRMGLHPCWTHEDVMAKTEGRSTKHAKSLNIALQGGGSHGAFTWGVLDKIFEDGRIWVDAISGTSAGDV